MAEELLNVYVYLQGALAIMLFLIFLVTLVHVKNGSNYTFLKNLIYMLLVNNLAVLLAAYAQHQLYIQNDTRVSLIYLLNISFALQDCPFNVVHYLLGKRYDDISKDAPAILESGSMSLEIKESRSKSNKVLLVLNIVLPWLIPVFLIPNDLCIIHDNICPTFAFLSGLIPALVGILAIISGFYLVKGVLQIRRFLVEHSTEVTVNTLSMILHAGSFGLYLVADVVQLVFYAMYIWKSEKDKSLEPPTHYVWAEIFWVIGQFIS